MDPIQVEVLGYNFYIYPEKYYEGIEKKLNFELDTVTLPNELGYYYSTLYGLDNIYVPFLATFQPLSIDKSLSELVNIVFADRRKRGILLKEGGEEEVVIETLEKIRRLEDVVFKGLVTRKVLEIVSKAVSIQGFCSFTGVVKYEEEQKLRKLGNGFAVYLSERVRARAGFEGGKELRIKLKVVGDRIIVERES